MTRSEEIYDILDIMRVIKGVWALTIAVPTLIAVLVGVWAFMDKEVADNRIWVHATMSLPAGSVDVNDIQKEVLAAADASGKNSSALSVAINETPSELGASYRTVLVSVGSQSGADEHQWLEDAIQNVAVAVEQYDDDLEQEISAINERRDAISRIVQTLLKLSAEPQSVANTIAIATTTATLVSVLRELEDEARSLAERGRGPLTTELRVERPDVKSNLKWLGLPIAAGIAGLLGVLFVAFTIDGIRLATSRRHPKE